MIYADNAGNHFLGDAIYSAGTRRLTGHPITGISSNLTNFCLQSGLKLKTTTSQSIPSQSNFESIFVAKMNFSASNDTTIGRYVFAYICGTNSVSQIGSSTRPLWSQVLLMDNSGDTSTSSTVTATGTWWSTLNNTGTVTTTSGDSHGIEGNQLENNYIAVSDGFSLAMVRFLYEGTSVKLRFWYAGRLADVNPNYAYYNTSVETDSIILTNNTTNSSYATIATEISAGHRIAGSPKQILTTGDAQYPIVCSDGQSPTTQWATDFYVFDNNATLGYPAIGRVRNLLLAQGSYTIGKPVRIQGTVQPDNGFNCWLPVGTFGGKVVLMRCYSSVEL